MSHPGLGLCLSPVPSRFHFPATYNGAKLASLALTGKAPTQWSSGARRRITSLTAHSVPFERDPLFLFAPLPFGGNWVERFSLSLALLQSVSVKIEGCPGQGVTLKIEAKM